MMDAYYLPEGDGRFTSTEWTTGPWQPGFQHGGPPAALLAHTAAVAGRPGMQVARATFEILRPIPVGPLAVAALVVRPGKKVEMIHATMSSGGIQVMDATIWRIRTADLSLPPMSAAPPPSQPADGDKVELFPTGDRSYLTSLDWSFTRGRFLEPGPATAWARMCVPLVAGTPVDPLSRVLVLADSGSGISAELELGRWLFVNPDLSVHLHRLPEGEWVCMEAETTLERHGIGLCTSTLYDEKGAIGGGRQSLFVEKL